MSNEIKNLAIWNQVCKSEASTLKHGDMKGQKIKSINGTSVFMKATKIFGPIGLGWGYDITKDEFITGSPIQDSQGRTFANEMMHTIQIKIWYMQDDKRIEMPPQFGHTPFILKTGNGPMTDFDAPKKSLTDAIKKSFSMLGFNADVFLGEWDGVTEAQLQAVQHADKAEKNEETEAKNYESLIDEAKVAIEEELPLIKSARLLTSFKNKWLRKAVNAPGIIRKIDSACAEKLLEIQESAIARRKVVQTNENNQEGNNNE